MPLLSKKKKPVSKKNKKLSKSAKKSQSLKKKKVVKSKKISGGVGPEYQIGTFGYKYGQPLDKKYPVIVDVRALYDPSQNFANRSFNPFNNSSRRSGKNKNVQNALEKQYGTEWKNFIETLCNLAERNPKIAFGCMSGVHRSVAIAELVGKCLRERGKNVSITHHNLEGANFPNNMRINERKQLYNVNKNSLKLIEHNIVNEPVLKLSLPPKLLGRRRKP